MSVEYLDLTDYVAIAAEVTSLDTTTIVKTTRLDLADSAFMHRRPASANR